MTDVEKILIQFFVVFFFIFLIYYLFVLRKCKKEKKYVPPEVSIILIKYKIDSKKINLQQMNKIVVFVTSLILAFAITVSIVLFDNKIVSLFLGTTASVLIAIIAYSIIGRIYKKQSDKEKKKK